MRSFGVESIIKIAIACSICAFLISPVAAGDRDWAVSLYGGRFVEGDMGQSLTLTGDASEATYVTGALTRKVFSYRERFDIELEWQVVKHLQVQHHWEFNAAIAGRLHLLPPSKPLDIGLAVGYGYSYATAVPEFEVEWTGGDTQKVLAYMLYELDFGLPKVTNFSLFTRIHHRSGIFGTYSSVRGASNSWAVGVKYRF